MPTYEIDYVIKGTDYVKADSPLEAEDKLRQSILESYETIDPTADIMDMIDVVSVEEVGPRGKN